TLPKFQTLAKLILSAGTFLVARSSFSHFLIFSFPHFLISKFVLRPLSKYFLHYLLSITNYFVLLHFLTQQHQFSTTKK
ncbi:hypothetical protein HMPREF9078_00170, partial [Capnocytophaga sp. oral taxon 380 str. F0488]